MRTARIQMKAHEDKRASIDIYGTIGRDFWGEGIDPKEFKDALDALGDIDLLEVRIHSYGGFVSEGMAIFNALNRHPAAKHVFVDGMAASMASVILMVGDKKYIASNASIMIHDPFNICIGSADDMLNCAADLEKSKDQLLDIYEKSAGISRDEISEKMSEVTRMNAKEALEWGFVDVIGDEVEEDHKNHENYFDFKIAAHADIEKIAPFLAFNSNSGNPEPDEDLSMNKQTPSGDAGEQTAEEIAAQATANQNTDQQVADATTAATVAETERVSGILALKQPGVEELVETLALDGKTTVAEAGLQIAKKLAEGSKDAAALATRKAASNAVVTEDPNAAPGTQAAISDGDDDAAWEANVDNCQQEFRGHKGSFIAYNQAARNGQIKILERSQAA